MGWNGGRMASSSPAGSGLVRLADGFPPSSREVWLAQAEQTLKGAPIGVLTRRSLEGTPIEVLYDASGTGPSPAKQQLGWDIRALVREPEVARANQAALDDLRGGATSVLLRLDPTGAEGVAVGAGDDLAQALEGILLDVGAVALDAGFLGHVAAEWLSAAAKGAPAARLAFHLDPLSAFAAAGASPGPIESHVTAAAAAAARLAPTYPRASLFLASGRVAHEAGAGEAVELALAAAAAVAYAKAMARAGFATDDAFDRIVLGLSVDTDVLLSIAKLRAARRLWARLIDACGVGGEARIEARSSERVLTRSDPWTNMVRLTAMGFAGAVGGADAVVLGAFTDALGSPTPFARRQARNIQLVLAEEASLGRVIDPTAGSGVFEALTDEIARGAWLRFQEIEAAGGATRALQEGLIAGWASDGRGELTGRFASRELKLLGVTDFPASDGAEVELAEHAPCPVEAPSTRLPGPDSRCPPLARVRLEDLA